MDYRLIRQSSGTLYWILQPFIHIIFRLLFRKIYLHNRKGIKPNTPVLIAANHPTAFIDPIFFCIFFDPPVYNMTRGDIFRKPFFRKLLESCNMFPVYRRRDGYEGRERNDEVFEYCKKKLTQRVTVNIFVEGEHHLDKRILPSQKGIARIAFGTYEQHPMEDFQIMPVGCNYFDGSSTRDEAKIIVGEPLMIKNYWESYQKNPGATINQLCRDIETALKKLCYNVEDPQDHPLADQLLLLSHNQHSSTALPVVEHHATPFWPEKAMLDQLNTMPEHEKNTLKDLCNRYFDALKQHGITDASLIRPEHASWTRTLLLIFLALPALAGYIIGWPIRRIAYSITRSKVKKKEFYTSALMGIAMVMGLLYFVLWMSVGLITGYAWILTVGILMPLLAWISIFWKETGQKWILARKAAALPQRSLLQEMREEIFTRLPV
ncbi:MAG: 1-acyl-sn-glycerol-3-phosphate acyltransferase [Chitinophagales bacterium]|nr:1-acyl-sn-glycerol-3-phosphate acyltransferase [Chitinophagales bacterium]